MNKPSTGQVLNAIGILMNNADWDMVPASVLQKIIDNPRDAGREFTAFLKNGGCVIVGESKDIPIDRTSAFDPIAFIGEGWSFAEARNPRSATIGLLDDYSQVKLSTKWLERRPSVNGEIRRTRIVADTASIPLHADHFLDLWNNKEKIPEKWKKVAGEITFDGDILLSPDDNRVALCLCWRGGQWRWDCSWLAIRHFAKNPSAVLAS